MGMRRVGIVGTGMLGSAVAFRLLDMGVEVYIYNRTGSKLSAVVARGAHACRSPREVAERSNLVITVVRDAKAVSGVSFGNDGIISGRHADLAVADMSTIAPLKSREITARYLQYNIDKIDIPVMGGPNVAASGDLVMMASGSKDAFDRNKGILEMVAKTVFYLGGPGVAHSVKLAMNLQITMLALALSEGLTLMKGMGVDPTIFLDVLNSTYFRTGMSKKKAYLMAEGKYDATFTLANLKKDISTIVSTAKSLGLDLPMIAMAEDVYGAAVEHGLGHVDYTGIIEHLKESNRGHLA